MINRCQARLTFDASNEPIDRSIEDYAIYRSAGALDKRLPPLFFLHNPKAGGSFINDVIGFLYEDGAICSNIENNYSEYINNAGDYRGVCGYKVYIGHYGREMFNQVSADHFCISNFRHPFSRVLSLYQYFRFSVVLSSYDLEKSEFLAVKAARELTFEQFASSDDPSILTYTANYHARQLTSSPWSLKMPDPAAVNDAVRTLVWYYVCEFSELSLLWAREALHWPPIRHKPVNTRSARADPLLTVDALAPKVIHRLLDINQLDLLAYRVGVDRLLSYRAH